MKKNKVILLQHPMWNPSIREFSEVHGLRILESEKRKPTGISFVEDQEYKLDAEEDSSTKEIESDAVDSNADQGSSSKSNRKQEGSSESKASGK